MAVEVKDVDKSIVIAGGVTTANFPQVARNFRRSASDASAADAASFFELGICGLGMEFSLSATEIPESVND